MQQLVDVVAVRDPGRRTKSPAAAGYSASPPANAMPGSCRADRGCSSWYKRSGVPRSRRRTAPRSRSATPAGRPRSRTSKATASREQDLAAVRRAHDARSAIHGGAEEIIVPPLVDADVQAAAGPQREGRASIRWSSMRVAAARPPQWRSADRRIRHVLRRPSVLTTRTAVFGYRLARHQVMLRKSKPHLLRLLLPQPGAVLDVGEQERRDWRDGAHIWVPRWWRCRSHSTSRRSGRPRSDRPLCLRRTACVTCRAIARQAHRRR